MPNCVLYVEDDPGDVTLLTYSLQAIGSAICLHHVHDGQAAIEYLTGLGLYADRDRNHFPKLLLLDLKMPRKDGFGVLEWLRQAHDIPPVPAIVFSASLREEDVTRAYQLGANAFIVKPSSLDARNRVLKRISKFWFGTAVLPP